MYIHIGKDFIINSKYIIAIFNIDYVKNTKEYKAMYKSLEEAGNIIVVSDKKEMSFILTEENNIKDMQIIITCTDDININNLKMNKYRVEEGKVFKLNT